MRAAAAWACGERASGRVRGTRVSACKRQCMRGPAAVLGPVLATMNTCEGLLLRCNQCFQV
eukprot:356730-Chlamydomonas_euryale.AAC.6